MDEKLKSRNMQKGAVFYVYVIFWQQSGQAGKCRERRYADHIFIQIYLRMLHFVVKFKKKCFRWQGALTPLTNMLRNGRSGIIIIIILCFMTAVLMR